jgi:hypothetical protein
MKQKVDLAILNELMNSPEVRKEAEGMSRKERVYFKRLLVSTGIYEQYVRERNGRRL